MLADDVQELDKLVGDFMRLVLFRSREKKPVTREMLKEVFGAYNNKSKVVKGVRAIAQHNFLDIFGFEMHMLVDERGAFFHRALASSAANEHC